MSWHCFCGESDEKLKWCKVMVASIHGGIPFTFVCHIKCLRNATSRFNYELDKKDTFNGIREGCEDLDDSFNELEEGGSDE